MNYKLSSPSISTYSIQILLLFSKIIFIYKFINPFHKIHPISPLHHISCILINDFSWLKLIFRVRSVLHSIAQGQDHQIRVILIAVQALLKAAQPRLHLPQRLRKRYLPGPARARVNRSRQSIKQLNKLENVYLSLSSLNRRPYDKIVPPPISDQNLWRICERAQVAHQPTRPRRSISRSNSRVQANQFLVALRVHVNPHCPISHSRNYGIARCFLHPSHHRSL